MKNLILTSALELAKKGFYIFPISPGKKTPPLVDSWQIKATRNIEQIKKWWEQWPEANIGIYTGKFGEDKYLLVVDIDVKNHKKGYTSLSHLQLNGLDLPETAYQKTPSGGMHLIFSAKVPIKNSVNKLGPGLDVRGVGGYILGGGSVLK